MSTYSEQSATAPAACWIECGWTLHSEKAVSGYRVSPDGCVDIIYDRERGLHAVGAMTTEQRFDFPHGASIAAVRFRPGMAMSYLGISQEELTDQSVPLQDLWPRRAHELKQRLDYAKSIHDAMRILFSGLSVPNAPPNNVQKAIQHVSAAHGNLDLNKVAHHANLSPRQFRRRCLEESGLNPKRLCRILRFRHACRMARVLGRPNWSAIAMEAGYFDQAHLIRDFVELTGRTPMAVFSNT